MRRIIAYTAIASVVIVALGYGAVWLWFCYPSSELACYPIAKLGEFYATSLRGSLFTGFLTLGGFLLSLKTFIVVNMKKEVFDTDAYAELWMNQSMLDKKNVGTLYQPLAELSEALVYAILSCVLTSVSQFTVGLAETVASSIFCMWAALLSILLLLVCLWSIRHNLNYMFRHLEKIAAEKAKKRETQRKSFVEESAERTK